MLPHASAARVQRSASGEPLEHQQRWSTRQLVGGLRTMQGMQTPPWLLLCKGVRLVGVQMGPAPSGERSAKGALAALWVVSFGWWCGRGGGRWRVAGRLVSHQYKSWYTQSSRHLQSESAKLTFGFNLHSGSNNQPHFDRTLSGTTWHCTLQLHRQQDLASRVQIHQEAEVVELTSARRNSRCILAQAVVPAFFYSS